MRRLFLLCACLLFGCSDPRREAAQLLRLGKESLRHGELATTEQSARRGLAIAAASDDRALEWKFRLLLCEALYRNGTPAQMLAEIRKPFPDGPEFAPLAARRKMLEGDALDRLGLPRDATIARDYAHQLALDARDEETLIDVEIRQGARLAREQEWERAEATLSRALRRAESAGLRFEVAGALVNLGMSRIDRNRYEQAIDYFQRAAVAAEGESSTLYSVARANLASCYYNLGEFDLAFEIQRQSITQHERSGAKLYLQSALGETGHAYLQMGDMKKATEHLERALKIAREIGTVKDAAIWIGNLAIVYSELGQWNKAEYFNQEASCIKEENGSTTPVYNTLNAARISNGRKQFAEGDRLYREAIATSRDDPAVLWEAHSELGRSAMLNGKPGDALREFEAAVRIAERTRSELLRTEYKLPFLTRLIRLYQAYFDALAAGGDFDRALAVADSSRAQTLADRFGSAPVVRLPADSFAKIARKTGASILTYWLGPKQSHAWVITPAGVHHAALAPEPEIAKLVVDYNGAIQQRLADPLRYRISSGERLYELLIAPVHEWLPAGSKIVIVADGVLSGFNFETLPVPNASPPRYLIEDLTIVIAPSIRLLSQTREAATQTGRLLVIGNPENADPAEQQLRYAAAEISSVARHFAPGSRLVLEGKDAVPEAYRRASPGQFSAIHFTAHSTASRESPLDSAVLLTGGKLYARDVLELPLRASLVTMSACRGVGSRNYNGEGLVGFAWAFLRAGARNVIAGLWDVNDQSTSVLMDTLYGELAAGKSPAEALRNAKLSLIRSSKNFHKPYYWGPFQVYTVEALR